MSATDTGARVVIQVRTRPRSSRSRRGRPPCRLRARHAPAVDADAVGRPEVVDRPASGLGADLRVAAGDAACRRSRCRIRGCARSPPPPAARSSRRPRRRAARGDARRRAPPRAGRPALEALWIIVWPRSLAGSGRELVRASTCSPSTAGRGPAAPGCRIRPAPALVGVEGDHADSRPAPGPRGGRAPAGRRRAPRSPRARCRRSVRDPRREPDRRTRWDVRARDRDRAVLVHLARELVRQLHRPDLGAEHAPEGALDEAWRSWSRGSSGRSLPTGARHRLAASTAPGLRSDP